MFFSQLSNRDSIRSTLAAVVLLLLKFSRPFMNAIFVFIAFTHESSFSFLTSMFRRNLTLPFLKFSCFFVVLFVSALFNLHFVCTIELSLINLNNFKYPTKIHLCSQANQSHLLRDLFSFSAC